MIHFERFLCWILRAHKWRRLRRGETSHIPAEQFGLSGFRICARCLTVRQVRQRKVKEAA